MPTGYTSELYDGTPVTTRDFILGCARAFGATIRQRDEHPSVPPRLIEADTSYYTDALARARETLKDALTWTEEDATERADKEYETALSEWNDSERRREEMRERYEDMLAKVRRWTPPTVEHTGLKDFMVEQIESSIRFDCSPYPKPVHYTGEAYHERVVSRARRNIEHYQEQIETEHKRVEGTNKWIAALYKSVASLEGVTQ